MTTGASPISEEVFDFLRICFGATVLEGYGMTETSCVISMTLPDDATAGTCSGKGLRCPHGAHHEPVTRRIIAYKILQCTKMTVMAPNMKSRLRLKFSKGPLSAWGSSFEYI